MGQEQQPAARTTGTQIPDIVNRAALGVSALTMSTTAMFTALAAGTAQGQPALVFGSSLLLQIGVAAFSVRRMFKSPTANWGAITRMVAAPLILAGAYGMANLQNSPEPPPLKAAAQPALAKPGHI